MGNEFFVVMLRADGFIALSRWAVFIMKSKSTPTALEARRMAASTPPAEGIAPMLMTVRRWPSMVNQSLILNAAINNRPWSKPRDTPQRRHNLRAQLRGTGAEGAVNEGVTS